MLLSALRVGSVFLLCILVRRLQRQISLAEMSQRPLEYLVLGWGWGGGLLEEKR